MKTDDHNFEKKFYEIYAKLILDSYSGNEYGQLILSDKPDIVSQDMKYGIEVTRAVLSEIREKQSYFIKHMQEKELSEVNKKKLARFCKGGYRVVPMNQLKPSTGNRIGAFCSPGFWISNEPIKQAIAKKIQKINATEYQKVDHLHLFVISDRVFDFDERDIDEIIADAAEKNRKAVKRFDKLYINDRKHLHSCDFHTGTYEKMDFQNDLNVIGQTAIELAKQGD